MKKRFIILFSVMSILLCLPIVANAEIVEQGSCGENVTYTLDDEGTLIISGEGEMENYSLSVNNGQYTSTSPFDANENIKSVIIGNSITSIGSCTFNGCSGLTDVIIQDSIMNIGYYTFYNCSGLTSVTIGSGVTKIDRKAFMGCDKLKDVYITDLAAWCNIEFVGSESYNYDIYYYSNPMYYADNLYINNELVTDLVIPDEVISIGNGTFYNFSGLTSVNIPDSVTNIGDDAFYGCIGLTNITIGNISNSDAYKFQGCTALKDIYYRGSFAEWKEVNPNNNSGPNDSTVHCTDITYDEWGNLNDKITYVLNDGTLTIRGEGDIPNYYYEKRAGSIGSYPYHIYCDAPFYRNKRIIKNAIIEEGITSIGNNLFVDCNGLTSVTIPATVTSIGGAAFNNSTFSVCTTLQTFNINPNNQNYVVVDGVLFNKDKTDLICYPKAKSNTNYTIPNSITKINEYTFKDCANLINITIPDSVTTIGRYAFENCSNLTSVTIGRGVTEIDDAAFEKCENLKSIYISDLEAWCNITFSVYTYVDSYYGTSTTYYSSNPLHYADDLYINNKLATDIVIPNSITYIPTYAFWHCKCLKSVIIPESVKNIGKNAFNGCSLTSITIPKSVTSINQDAFLNSGLKAATIQDGTVRIPQYAFSKCSSLKSVSIPKSVQNIANNAFEYCIGLSDIYYAGTAEEWKNINIGTTGNDSIGNAIIHYNSTSMPEPTPAPTPAPTPYIPLDCNVDYVVENNEITFTVEVKDTKRADELNNVQLFMAEYNEKGQLSNIAIGERSNVNDGKITITAVMPDTDEYKFFLWDGHLAPLMEVVDKENIK